MVVSELCVEDFLATVLSAMLIKRFVRIFRFRTCRSALSKYSGEVSHPSVEIHSVKEVSPIVYSPDVFFREACPLGAVHSTSIVLLITF